MKNWYVINTKPQRENDVSQRLSGAGFEVCNPKVKDFNCRVKSLFPNYIFTCCDFDESANYQLIKYTRGVNKVLGTKTNPVQIPTDVVLAIRVRLGPGEVLERDRLVVGSQVKIKKGLLKDLIAIIEKPSTPDGRVAVLLKLYERELRTKVSVKELV
ncbi:MAG TPA: transcription termination/antitermination NusG family protein, partial [bacterium]|nr:transcription termination/antitermination NusG family protein [bacterium]